MSGPSNFWTPFSEKGVQPPKTSMVSSKKAWFSGGNNFMICF